MTQKLHKMISLSAKIELLERQLETSKNRARNLQPEKGEYWYPENGQLVRVRETCFTVDYDVVSGGLVGVVVDQDWDVTQLNVFIEDPEDSERCWEIDVQYLEPVGETKNE